MHGESEKREKKKSSRSERNKSREGRNTTWGGILNKVEQGHDKERNSDETEHWKRTETEHFMEEQVRLG